MGVIDNPRVGCAAEGGRKGDGVTAPGQPQPTFCPQGVLPLAISHQGAERVGAVAAERGREEWRTSARSPRKRKRITATVMQRPKYPGRPGGHPPHPDLGILT